MREWLGKRYWVVGASEGLGLALAQQLSRAGAEVILSARHAETLERALLEMPGRASRVVMDVTKPESVNAAMAEVGEVDGLICLAGANWPVFARQWDAGKAEAMCDINLTGTMRVLGAVMPSMVARGRGHILLVGAMPSLHGQPGAAAFAASKAGIAALAEGLASELEGSGVQIQLARPGFIRTRQSEHSPYHMPFMMEPQAAAQQIFELMQTAHLRKSFPWRYSWATALASRLPASVQRKLFPQR